VSAFGHVVPISGSLKSTFPVVSFTVDRLLSLSAYAGLLQLGIATAVVAWFTATGWDRVRPTDGRRPGRPRVLVTVLVAVWLGCVLHFLNTMLFMNWAAHWWHYASYVPVTVILMGLAFERLRSGSGRPAAIGAALAAVALAISACGVYLDVKRRGDHHQPWCDAVEWVNANLPAGTVIGMTDCGLFGYLSERPTVNLDGVINGYDYQDALRDGRLSEYLQSCRVTHIADYEVRYDHGKRAIRLPARLHGAAGGALVAVPKAEVYRSEPYRNAFDTEIHFVIWRLDGLMVLDDAGRLDEVMK
jgi:hypothetical protein